MHRFIFDPAQKFGDQAWLDGEESNHLTRVLRLKTGDEAILFDGQGNEYTARVAEITKDKVLMTGLQSTGETRESPLQVCLVQAVAKGEKMDWIVQKATELGVNRILPVLTERTIVKLDRGKAIERRDRWQKIAREATKQCRRTIIPEVIVPISWRELLTQWDRSQPLLIPWEQLRGIDLKTALRRLKPSASQGTGFLGLVIGPEGGLTEEEVKAAEEIGALPVSLGPRILRTETAGLAALAAIMYELGDWG
ncbi:16S rRNA (uracil(1498)-N(3))-methyltransferase [Heliobacterium chlorum]|uniref:Ribosomal RNA small subunit methyltransferase E n=1 Tax=Heliobacterium chlorum TaxID=2698 RepID=A0ABR7T2P2_HELCL|nr:16S rRNA (uracil(1498)-N(3))-methyltransferase [Heliobacterium chlorum]MBC9785038.1 16S rRNA (uracil(1498)-N(3))-methyltransferase [Heliobacterium chlorum]